MTGRDANNERLISAYLDGELTSDERQHVERLLATNAECRRLLDDLRMLADELQQLPRFSLDEAFVNRVVAQTRHVAQSPASAGEPSGPVASQELLSAYVDDELSGDDMSRAEQQLAADTASQRYVREIHALDRALKALPKRELDDDFADRVLRRAERTMLAPDAIEVVVPVDPEAAVTTARRPAPEAARVSWRGFVWSAAAVAAALVLAFVFRDDPGSGPAEVVSVPNDPADSAVIIQERENPPDELLVGPERIPGSAGPDNPVELPAARTRDGVWPVVLAMQQNVRQRFILIYEVSVTSLGAEQGVFARLLTRHNIGFRDTVAIGDEEQRDLLKRRFMQGAVIAPPGEEGMDEVRLYLVSCTGNEADALYQDLAGGPPGFASFSLNLTTGEAGDGVLNRVCEASDIDRRSSEAVGLLASFAMMSETARNLGVFGTIEWVDPELLMPPPQSGGEESAKPKPAGQDAAPQADQGDFQCELLFIVRNLQPNATEPAADDR